jgi:deoxyribodipyrimidine photo-lyase
MTSQTRPLILWFRRDLRRDDHPMLAAAVATGRPLIPLFVLDPETEAIGAAAKWRLGLAVERFGQDLAANGSGLVLRRGPALAVLRALVAETGAEGVWWSRLYDPASVARDMAVKAALKDSGVEARSFPGHVLVEPWKLSTGTGDPYRVFTPFWKALRSRGVAAPTPMVARLPAPATWPGSDTLADWQLGAAMNRGAAVLLPHQAVGDAAARDRLDSFLSEKLATYAEDRNHPALPATSRLSENLTYGEIGVRRIWHAALHRLEAAGQGAETFLKELVWRDFACHLIHHFPQIETRNWRPEWDNFPWRPDNADAERWRRGQTGEPLVDAAMRELYVTGTMHNRARMIAASYLTKHLLTDWRVGQKWFAECLTDWDPASNAMGWQWVAGSGPDAAPYFRIFNPETQAEKFDASGSYRRHWLEGPGADEFHLAAPRSWALDPVAPPPSPIVSLAEGRVRALAAFAQRNA